MLETPRTHAVDGTNGSKNYERKRRNPKMSATPEDKLWGRDTQLSFSLHLHGTLSRHRVTQAEKERMVQWLRATHLKPTSQKESSRRHYVRNNFRWDEESQVLFAVPKQGRPKREVVTDDMILDIVESVHERNKHAGWDATWRDVSGSYYGILRSDVIFLLRRCPRCAGNPRKRPKSSLNTRHSTQLQDQPVSGSLDLGGLFLNAENVPGEGAQWMS